MRTVRKFTPKLIRSWIASRGEGVFEDYIAWHQVSRSDPASMGRSHLTFCPKLSRLRHHLSDCEQVVFGLCLMVQGCIDIREQKKLYAGSHINELSHYDSRYFGVQELGTLDFSKFLGIKHPKLKLNDESEPWVMTTDFLIVYEEDNVKKLIAVAFKLEKDLSTRNKQLLSIEKAYWEAEGAEWILITDKLIPPKVHSTILKVLSWVLHPIQISDETKLECSKLSFSLNGLVLNQAYELISTHFKVEKEIAQNIFWQSVWAGNIRLDLNRWHFASEKIKLLSEDDFKKQNPVLARRTSWI
ncbi:MAG: hypothetical protein CTY12_04155 [Methylotenera sp.]|nr:MAG: hypothetical protein CTY12_04155 [Methylotenera sp.]